MHERWQQRRAHFLQPGHGPRALSFPWTFVYPLPPPQRSCDSDVQCSGPAQRLLCSLYPEGWGGGQSRRGQAVPRKPTGTPVFKESLKNRARVPAGDMPLSPHTSRCSQQGPSSADQN